MVNVLISVLVSLEVGLKFDLGLGKNNTALISKVSLRVGGRLGVKVRVYLL